jgi:hypothetical protein
MTDRAKTAQLRLCLFPRYIVGGVAWEMLNNRKQRKP